MATPFDADLAVLFFAALFVAPAPAAPLAAMPFVVPISTALFFVMRFVVSTSIALRDPMLFTLAVDFLAAICSSVRSGYPPRRRDRQIPIPPSSNEDH
ncbi:MAG: hypothetical protein ACJ8AD_19810, partial [Gemmatimonadaceae bacterium]